MERIWNKLENGTTLKVGEKVTQLSWGNDKIIDITFIGKTLFLGVDNWGYESAYFIIEDWLPYTEPKEEPKPFEGYQKWYIHLSGKSNRVRIEYMTIEKSLELRKSTHILGVYTETEAIELGLPV